MNQNTSSNKHLMLPPTMKRKFDSSSVAESTIKSGVSQLSKQRNQKKILTEEQFTESLDRIIERDYFPHLNALRMQLDILNQPSKHENSQTPRNQKLDFIKLNSLIHYELSKKEMQDLDDMTVTSNASQHPQSISEFLSSHTSEDNVSFQKLLRKTQEEHQTKYHWIYENSESLKLTDGSTLAKKRAGMLMLYYIGNRVLSIEERMKMDKYLEKSLTEGNEFDNRPNSTEMTKFRVRNQLMFPPELKDSEDTCGIASSNMNNPMITNGLHSSGIALIKASDDLTKNKNNILPITNDNTLLLKPSNANNNSSLSGMRPDKVIQRSNTNLNDPLQLLLRQLIPIEEPHTPSNYSTFGSEKSSNSSGIWTSYESGKRNYRAVPMTPLITPDQLSSPLFTWGNMLGTPLRLDDPNLLQNSINETYITNNVENNDTINNDAQSHSFQMQPLNQREMAIHSLDMRNKQKQFTNSKSSNSSMNKTLFINKSSCVDDSASVYSNQTSTSHQSQRNLSSREKFNKLSSAGQALAMKLQKQIPNSGFSFG
eukprot:gene6674-9156_t